MGWVRDGIHGPWRTELEPSSFCLPPGHRVLKSRCPFTRDNQARERRQPRTNRFPWLNTAAAGLSLARLEEAPRAQGPERGFIIYMVQAGLCGQIPVKG